MYERNLEQRDVTLIRINGRLTGSHTVQVGGQEYTAERLVIATGGRPIVPQIPGAGLGITSNGFFELNDCPNRVALIGSGYIAVEFAGMFSALGAHTTILVRKDGVLRKFDALIRDQLHQSLAKEDIRLETGAIPRAIEKSENALRVLAEDGREFGPFDCVIWAVGRTPNTEELNTDSASLALDRHGFVSVDDYQQTNVEPTSHGLAIRRSIL